MTELTPKGTFVLTMGINLVNDVTGSASDLKSKLKDRMTEYLTSDAVAAQIGKGWSLAWGPVVYQNTDSKTGPEDNLADNALVVYASPDGKTHVMATAGTNTGQITLKTFGKNFDWGVEDFKVKNLDNLASGLKGKVSQGTMIGIGILLAMKDDSGKTVQEYLSSVVDRSNTLIIGGHSLGGALTSALGPVLFPSQEAKAAWANVFIMPSAGPSIGDQDFVDQVKALFPPQAAVGDFVWGWNNNLRNSKDAIPHTWNATELGQLSSLYDVSTFSWAEATLLGLLKLINNLVPSPNPYEVTQNDTFKGEQKGGQITSASGLIDQLTYQHISAYFNYFDLTDVANEFDKLNPS